MVFEILMMILIGAVVLVAPLTALLLGAIAFFRTRRLKELARRVGELEIRLTQLAAGQPAESLVAELVPPAVATPVAALPPASPQTPFATVPERSFRWEAFIGQKAFGWMAVVLMIFSVAFFLRLAYQNNWIGPVGRVAIGELAGAALVFVGWLHHRRGGRLFAGMLSAAGIVVLYLATYSAFGFYRLLPQQQAGLFLAVLVIESMIVAVLYDSSAVALMAVLGGLMTPLLMVSERDAYSELFTYLAVLDASVVVAMCLRAWWAIGSVAFLGTHGLFWSWYFGNYHPEKFAWAMGFQALIFAVFLAHNLTATLVMRRKATWEDLARFLLNAILGFAALYVLTKEDYRLWLGSAAVGMATLYAVVARATLGWQPREERLLLTALAVSVGFLAWTLPIQADARWVSFGWAAMGGALFWFGQRISSRVLRIMAAALGVAATWRLLLIDTPWYTRDPFVPILNRYALPSIGVAVCVLAAVVVARPFLPRRQALERLLVSGAGVVGIGLLWLVLSVECYGYFDALSLGNVSLASGDVLQWHWRGQLALSMLWSAFAAVLLVLGFRLDRPQLRWLAILLFAVTVGKLFLVDMANVQQVYRILAFFILAVVLGLVARAYQRFRGPGLAA